MLIKSAIFFAIIMSYNVIYAFKNVMIDFVLLTISVLVSLVKFDKA